MSDQPQTTDRYRNAAGMLINRGYAIGAIRRGDRNEIQFHRELSDALSEAREEGRREARGENI